MKKIWELSPKGEKVQLLTMEAPVPRAEAIKTLRERGFEYKDLRTKTKDQLNDML